MNIKRHFFNFSWYLTRKIKRIGFFSLLLIMTVAQSEQLQFDNISQLGLNQIENASWLPLVRNPSNNQQYFAFNAKGNMYLVEDGMKVTQSIVELNTSHQRQSIFELSAIALHPNFSLRDQLGYGTFYSAHFEAQDKESNTKRLKERDSKLTLKFDAVITEWQFSSAKHQRVDAKSKREIIRIAVPEKSMTIKHMSFSPYAKSWNDDFGLLFVAINGLAEQPPLYSGVILRINPAKFGLRSYTIPNSNPFIKDAKIKDEIYLLGGQNIKKFSWSDKHSTELLLSHFYNNQSFLSLTTGAEDLRNKEPNNVLYRGDRLIEDIQFYHGRQLPNLRNKLLLLTKNKQNWQIESVNKHAQVAVQDNAENTPQQEWQFTTQQLASDNHITLSSNKDDELLVVDNSEGVVFQISSKFASGLNVNNIPADSNQQTTSVLSSYVVVVLLIAAGLIFYIIKRNVFSAKHVVRKQFAQVELSESQQQMGLYHRHQKTTDTILEVAAIGQCTVQLNGYSINVINKQSGYGFNDSKEQALRDLFVAEQVHKMIDGKVRQVSLLFTDLNEKNYTVCLYMRKGSDRITKRTYTKVIEDVIDWCWFIAEKINEKDTAQRVEKPIQTSTVDKETNKHHLDQAPLHNQAAAIRPVAQPTMAESKSLKVVSSTEYRSKPANVNVAEAVQPSNTVNTELVNALEKLVDLKQQGFLTQEEFIKAKENLLQSLFDK